MKKAICATLFWLACCIPLMAQGDFQKGLSYYKQKQYDKAIAEFEPIVAANPDYEDGYRILGHSYLQTGQNAKAAQAFRTAVELKGDNFVSHLGLGTAYFNQGKNSEAVAALLRAERYSTNARERVQLYSIRGAAYFNQGEYSKAVADLEKAQGIQRGGKDELLQLGMAFYKIGNQDKARRYLEQVKALDPDNSQALKILAGLDYQKGLSALQRRDYSTAAALLRGYARRHPENGEAWFNLGLAQLGAKDYADAERSLLESQKLLGEKSETSNRLGFIYEVTKRYTRSLDAYQKAFKLSQDPEIKASIDRVKERIRRQNTGQ